jgi:nucleotide-binding universal stress UspA family protein
MFQHILLPTDGSELAEKAIRYGVTFAKEQGAKITAIIVSRPFHLMTLEPGMLTDTPAEYAKRVAERTKKISGGGDSCCEGGWCVLRRCKP